MAERRIDELRRRIERDPGSRLFAQLAEELRKEGELEEAIGAARAGLEKHPSYPSARLTLGRALLDSGDPAAARVELEAAVAGAPDNILASRLLGEALETLGDLGSALLQYRTTLQLAPNDGHVEARVRAIQERLGSPTAGTDGGDAPEVTRPMAAPAADEGDEEDELPPTIRIRMPGDSPAPLRAPLPPTPARPRAADAEAPPGGAGPEETTLPATAPGEGGTQGAPVVFSDGETASELPITLPMPGVERDEDASPVAREGKGAGDGEPVEHGSPNIASEEQEAPAEEPARPVEEAGEAAGEPDPLMDEAPAESSEVADARHETDDGTEGGGDEPEENAPTDSDLAPTLPRSRAAEFAALDEPLPPTLPPGVITSVEEPVAASDDDAPVEAAKAPPAAEATAGAIPEQAEDTPDDGGPGPEDAESPVPPAPLSSATLAELYFQQGLLERAVEVYREVVDEDPGSGEARVRLEELEALVSAGAAELPVPAAGEADDAAAKRRALERTIERLEELLAIVRRR